MTTNKRWLVGLNVFFVTRKSLILQIWLWGLSKVCNHFLPRQGDSKQKDAIFSLLHLREFGAPSFTRQILEFATR